MTFRLLLAGLLAGGLSATAMAQAEPPVERPSNIDALIDESLTLYPSAGLAIIRIEDGERSWAAYGGEQGPGVPVTEDTLFNTASIAKTLTAELTLRLAAAGEINLDEPISSEYVHPDLADDPRHELLTPAIILSHQTGLKNWAYQYDDDRLAFTYDPGNGYSYSGAAYEMLAEFLARRMDTPFEDLMQAWVFAPLHAEAYLGAEGAPSAHLTTPMGHDGQYGEIQSADYAPGAADNLFVTAGDYTTLLLGMMEAEANGPMAGARGTQQVSTANEAPCMLEDQSECPENGHTLGWSVSRFDDAHFIFHGGSDWAENALALYDMESGDGYVVMVNGGNGLGSFLHLITAFDPDNQLISTLMSMPQIQGALSQMRAPEE
ncbi:serine hydrolase domain-containing protein [Oceanicaulis sp. LC35]|uniref:serine hydrolase domain-containing protein n=1 Tax=Oceanicaulis sp. LC35 TaxID=3349635 RepID=UPI003F83AF52